MTVLGTVTTKSAATSRSNTTTYADDPHLANIALAIGTYEVELIGYFTLATTTAQKIKTQWAFTGTWNGSTAARACIGPGSAQVAGPTAVTDMFLQGLHANGQDAVYDAAAGTGSYTSFRELCGNVNVTVAGNLSIQWAQSALSANNTNLQEGSYVRVRKLT
jgi:hypothetical protein